MSREEDVYTRHGSGMSRKFFDWLGFKSARQKRREREERDS
jgi:hypothetical protein